MTAKVPSCFKAYLNAIRCAKCPNAGLCEYITIYPHEAPNIIFLDGKSFQTLIEESGMISSKKQKTMERAPQILRELDRAHFRANLANAVGLKRTTLYNTLDKLRIHNLVGYFDRPLVHSGRPARYWCRKIFVNPYK